MIKGLVKMIPFLPSLGLSVFSFHYYKKNKDLFNKNLDLIEEIWL